MTLTRTLTLITALLLASCVEVGVNGTEPQGSGDPLPPFTGGGDDDDASDDNDVMDDDDASDDDDSTPEDEGDDDDDATEDDTSDDDDSTPEGDDDDTTPAPTPTGDVSWWYRTENSVQYDAIGAFAWSWAWQLPGDGDCSDCYVLLGLAANAVTISGGVSQQSDLAALPEGTIISIDVIMQNDDEPEVWSCQNGAPSGVLRVWWGGVDQTVCTLDWGSGCTREVKLGVYNCNW